MSCCEKKKYDRLKDFKHAFILAKLEANIRGIEIAFVREEHHLYGYYYTGIPYDEAKGKYKILRRYKPDEPVAVQEGD
jgi:hypothetical protein